MSKASKKRLFGAVAGVLAVLGGVWGYMVAAPAASQFPVDTYISGATALSGNRYELKARIEKQLGGRAAQGRIILARETIGGRPIPFLDAGEAPNFNPEPGQLYSLTVNVGSDGLLELAAFRKL